MASKVTWPMAVQKHYQLLAGVCGKSFGSQPAGKGNADDIR